MTAFGWKRKIGQNFSKGISSKFSEDSDVENANDEYTAANFKKRKENVEENRKIKSEELKAEGVKLAQQNRFDEAVSCWDKALNLMPKDEKVLEMKAQALLQLNQHYPAVQAAEMAVKVNPCWWIAYQTLGRSQLGMGDLQMAKVSFSKAIHLNPTEKELWEEDLNWTLKLINQEVNMTKDSDSVISDDKVNVEICLKNNML